ncbi:MAG: class I SAM-dependent methyltransferase, partial [Deltaproteobacteria bacterium]|nr:class I SAM-dependent methyltransferase [Deltaproteobacteria bacterium]
DFLSESSPFYPIKRLSTAIYREQLAQAVALAPRRESALDAGCGIGRSTILASERFARVVAFDPCRANIDLCEARCEKNGREGKELHWDGIEFLDTIPGEEFDFVLALEFVCYTGDPAHVVAALARVLKPGGTMMMSVEAFPGALIAGDTPPDSADLGAIVRRDEAFTVRRPGRWVRLYQPNSLASLCRGAGLDPLRISPSHVFGEGPFWQTVDDERLRDDEYLQRVAKADREFRLGPDASRFARVLTAVATKPRKA